MGGGASLNPPNCHFWVDTEFVKTLFQWQMYCRAYFVCSLVAKLVISTLLPSLISQQSLFSQIFIDNIGWISSAILSNPHFFSPILPETSSDNLWSISLLCDIAAFSDNICCISHVTALLPISFHRFSLSCPLQFLLLVYIFANFVILHLFISIFLLSTPI